MKKYAPYLLPVVAIAIAALVAFSGSRQRAQYRKMSGFVFGTSYNITYQSDEDLSAEINGVFDAINNSLSPFNESSIISAVNNNKAVKLDSMFIEVFTLAQSINADTQGAFDITVAPLVNAWGFGFKNGSMPDDMQIDSLRSLVGFEKVTLSGGKVVKQDARMMLDCSAIAKGYAVDKVGQLLGSKGVENMMVEIGGEIVARGKNGRGEDWRIGVTKPTDDTLSTNSELQTVLTLTDIAMATSGNYRNFYYKDGKKYAHTIDPQTGRPVQHSILSATVLAPTCAVADAYATSFMVLGLEKAKQVLRRHPDMKGYLIYTNAKGEYCVWSSPGLQ